MHGKDTFLQLEVLERLYEMYFFDKNYADAENTAKRILEVGRRNYPEVSKYAIEAEVKLGDLAYEQKRPEEAAAHYKRAKGMTKTAYGKTSPYLKTVTLRLARVDGSAVKKR
jgi:tetratricopeptide (TPR) repeat protein